MYQIRNALEKDFPVIQAIYGYARDFMARSGNPNQWGTTHPLTSQLEDDIQNGNLYVAEDETGIHGVFAFLLENDPTYAYIEGGNWHSEDSYGTIHRVASDGSGGLFPAVLSFCKEKTDYLRIDTHHDNKPMQHVVEKHGFRRCGIIYVSDGSPRIAYDIKYPASL